MLTSNGKIKRIVGVKVRKSHLWDAEIFQFK